MPSFRPVTIGILTYNNEKYVDYCLPSLLKQKYPHLRICILDNNSSDNTADIIEKKYPEVKLIRSNKNHGFAKGHNILLRECKTPYYLCLNIDMIFETNFVKKQVEIMERYPKCASVTGKLLKWNFNDNKKTQFIDTVGLKASKNHRFSDIGQGEKDNKQYNEEREIFGCSGAAVLYRTRYLYDVAYNNNDQVEFFDELMFMYKEDIDLAYRLRWSGFSAYYTPFAIAYHDRTASKIRIWQRKKNKSEFIRKHSFRNQYILENKHFSKEFSRKTKLNYYFSCFLRRLYISFFERDLLSVYPDIEKNINVIEAKKRKIKHIITPNEMEKWFSFQ